MTTTDNRKPLIHLKFEGSAIYDGRILLNDLLLFVENFQKAIARTIDVLERGTSTRSGRRQKVTQILSSLEVVAMEESSFALALDLRRDAGELLPGFDIGEKAVFNLTSGIDVMDKDVALPDGYDEGVLRSLREAGKIVNRGIDTIQIGILSGDNGYKKITFTASTQDHIITRIRSYEHAWAEVEGRLLMADVKEDTLKCRLHPSTGAPIICSYDEDMTDTVMSHLRKFVQVRGDVTVDIATNRMRSMVIRDIEPVERFSPYGITVMPPSEFWEAKSFDDLAMEQGVYPIDDWEKLTGKWPADADFDSFLEAVRSTREH